MKLEKRKIEFTKGLENICTPNTGFSNMMEEVIYRFSEEINKKKELLIKQKVKELTGIEIDIQEESRRRFRRFCTVKEGDRETVYFNDGSIEGKRIVTFVKKDIPFNTENFTLAYEESYY